MHIYSKKSRTTFFFTLAKSRDLYTEKFKIKKIKKLTQNFIKHTKVNSNQTCNGGINDWQQKRMKPLVQTPSALILDTDGKKFYIKQPPLSIVHLMPFSLPNLSNKSSLGLNRLPIMSIRSMLFTVNEFYLGPKSYEKKILYKLN